MRAAGSVPSAGREAEPDQGDLPIRALLVSGIARSGGDPRLPQHLLLIIGERLDCRQQDPFAVSDDHLGDDPQVLAPDQVVVDAPKEPTTTIKSPLGR